MVVDKFEFCGEKVKFEIEFGQLLVGVPGLLGPDTGIVKIAGGAFGRTLDKNDLADKSGCVLPSPGNLFAEYRRSQLSDLGVGIGRRVSFVEEIPGTDGRVALVYRHPGSGDRHRTGRQSGDGGSLYLFARTWDLLDCFRCDDLSGGKIFVA